MRAASYSREELIARIRADVEDEALYGRSMHELAVILQNIYPHDAWIIDTVTYIESYLEGLIDADELRGLATGPCWRIDFRIAG